MGKLVHRDKVFEVGYDAFEVHDCNEPGAVVVGFVAQEEPTVWSDGSKSQWWVGFRLSGKVYPELFRDRAEAERHIRIDRKLTERRTERRQYTTKQRRKYGTAPKRDGQRKKLYAAENEAFASYPQQLRGRAQLIALAQVYAEQLGRKAPGVYLKRGRRSHYDPNTRAVYLAVTHGATRDWVLTHELCHFWDDCTGANKPWHGREFAALHLDVVTRVLGRAWGEKLRAAYVKHGVKFRAARKRELTDEQRAILRERLAKARAAKAEKGNA